MAHDSQNFCLLGSKPPLDPVQNGWNNTGWGGCTDCEVFLGTKPCRVDSDELGANESEPYGMGTGLGMEESAALPKTNGF